MPRSIPATMATQHPDNARPPYWEKDGDGFVSVQEEPAECVSSFRDLKTQEFMWDWEGKLADEAVVDKFFTQYHDYFRAHRLGRDCFLTFRIPNVWQERGYHLIRALMVILTAEDFARDIRFHAPPLFEVILPMTENARQLIYIQRSFRDLARFKSKTFRHHERRNNDYLNIIPLVEGIEQQMRVDRLLARYLKLHEQLFKARPQYLRPFLARSDPALVSGLPATVLANKLALSSLVLWSRRHRVPVFPIIGVGSLPFRGGLNPLTVADFMREYAGVRTVTIQSAFRYDYPLTSVTQAIRSLNARLSQTRAAIITDEDASGLEPMVKRFASAYQETLASLLPDLEPFFAAVPKRRERRLHVGLLAYPRHMGAHTLPRAINFTAALYSLGIPPEFLGWSQALPKFKAHKLSLLKKYYINVKQDLSRAGRFLNLGNLAALARAHKPWRRVQDDIACVASQFSLTLGPVTQAERLHRNLSGNVLLLRNKPQEVTRLIAETGRLRRSLG